VHLVAFNIEKNTSYNSIFDKFKITQEKVLQVGVIFGLYFNLPVNVWKRREVMLKITLH